MKRVMLVWQPKSFLSILDFTGEKALGESDPKAPNRWIDSYFGLWVGFFPEEGEEIKLNSIGPELSLFGDYTSDRMKLSY